MISRKSFPERIEHLDFSERDTCIPLPSFALGKKEKFIIARVARSRYASRVYLLLNGNYTVVRYGIATREGMAPATRKKHARRLPKVSRARARARNSRENKIGTVGVITIIIADRHYRRAIVLKTFPSSGTNVLFSATANR